MAVVAVLGMGLLGSGFAENLAENGHDVRVWNRTRSKCARAEAAGATVCDTPADAVRGVERVHLVLSEDSAVDAVIEAMGDALDAPIIDHSTNAPAKVLVRVHRLRGAGITYLHAPVFMGPQNSRDATGSMLVSGDPALIDRWTDALAEMTGTVRNLGDDPSRAATVKLTGNAVLIGLTSVMGDVFRIGTANGMTPEETLELFDVLQPTAGGMGRRALADGPVGFELAMARKDVRLMIDAAGGPADLVTLPAIADAMDAAIEDGQGDEDFTKYVVP
jgi:3-hydroxyisobutyrate dehydrogenase